MALDVGLGRVIAWSEEWESWGIVVAKWDVWQGRGEGEMGWVMLGPDNDGKRRRCRLLNPSPAERPRRDTSLNGRIDEDRPCNTQPSQLCSPGPLLCEGLASCLVDPCSRLYLQCGPPSRDCVCCPKQVDQRMPLTAPSPHTHNFLSAITHPVPTTFPSPSHTTSM